MKIGVLTHPMHGNYGGMLQAFAMVDTLRQQGHDAYNLEYMPRNYLKRISNRAKNIKEWLRVYLLRYGIVFYNFPTPTRLQVAIGSQFTEKHIPTLSLETAGEVDEQPLQLDAIVVGSDQVWRGAYAKQMKTLPFYFLDFARKTLRESSISYAASFGTNTWEGDEEDTAACAQLLREFKAVSVRETSGIDLCAKLFAVEAEQMPDPTMLLPISRYSDIIEGEQTWLPENKFIGSYVLDHAPHISTLLTDTAQGIGIELQQLKAITQARLVRDRFPHSVAQWLRLIRDAEYLITDSFHGCVFAILFNTPFVCLGNKRRGTTRFDALLSKYNLTNRLVQDTSAEDIQEVLRTPIDWDKVNAKIAEERARGLQFLNTHLPA